MSLRAHSQAQLPPPGIPQLEARLYGGTRHVRHPQEGGAISTGALHQTQGELLWTNLRFDDADGFGCYEIFSVCIWFKFESII